MYIFIAFFMVCMGLLGRNPKAYDAYQTICYALAVVLLTPYVYRIIRRKLLVAEMIKRNAIWCAVARHSSGLPNGSIAKDEKCKLFLRSDSLIIEASIANYAISSSSILTLSMKVERYKQKVGGYVGIVYLVAPFLFRRILTMTFNDDNTIRYASFEIKGKRNTEKLIELLG